MSFELPAKRAKASTRPSWSGAAFIVEAILLLVFLVAALGISARMLSTAASNGAESGLLSNAVAAASNAAERFAADPAHAAGEYTEGDLSVTCRVAQEHRDGGTLYHGTVSVYSGSSADPVYTISTSRYESEVG